MVDKIMKNAIIALISLIVIFSLAAFLTNNIDLWSNLAGCGAFGIVIYVVYSYRHKRK